MVFQELFNLQSKLGTMSTDTSVSMIEVDMGKSFDIASALNKLRIDYEKSVNQHREEADAYYKIKVLANHLNCINNTPQLYKAEI